MTVKKKRENLTNIEKDILNYLIRAYEKYPEPLLTVHSPYGYNAYRLAEGKRRLNDFLLLEYFNNLEELGYIRKILPNSSVYYVVVRK